MDWWNYIDKFVKKVDDKRQVICYNETMEWNWHYNRTMEWDNALMELCMWTNGGLGAAPPTSWWRVLKVRGVSVQATHAVGTAKSLCDLKSRTTITNVQVYVIGDIRGILPNTEPHVNSSFSCTFYCSIPRFPCASLGRWIGPPTFGSSDLGPSLFYHPFTSWLIFNLGISCYGRDQVFA